jgi:hypothetical protein
VAWADTWVVERGAAPRPDWSVDESYEPEVEEAAGFDPEEAEPALPASDADPVEEEAEALDAPSLEDARFEGIFDDSPTQEIQSLLPSPVVLQSAPSAVDDWLALPDQWVFTSKGSKGTKQPESAGVPEPQSPASQPVVEKTPRRRFRGRKTADRSPDLAEPSEALPFLEPVPPAEPSPEQVLQPRAEDDSELGPNFEPEATVIPERRMRGGLHRRRREHARKRRTGRETALPPEPEERKEELAGVGADVGGALVVGGRGGGAAGSAVRILAITLPLVAATLAYLSFIR